MTNSFKAVEIIRSHSNGSQDIIIETTCKRCSGNGVLPQFRHMNAGRCFECEGLGVTEQQVKAAHNDTVTMVNRTTEVKKLKPVNDHEAMRNSMLQTNAEHKARMEAIKQQKEEDAKLLKEMEEDNYKINWDDF